MDLYSNILKLLWQKEVANLEIKKIEIHGFRNISSVKVSLGAITALVAVNGYGKSNLVDAIDFAFDFIHAPNQTKPLMMCAKNCIPILKKTAARDFCFEILMGVNSAGIEYDVKYAFSFAWGTDKSPAEIKSEHLDIKLNETGKQYKAYINRDEKRAVIRPSEKARCSKSIAIDENSLVINKLLAIDDLFYADIISQVNNMQFFVERHLDATASFMPDPFIVKGFKELELQGINSIPRAIYYLKKEYQDKYEILIDAFEQLFPNIKSVEVREIKLNQSEHPKMSDKVPFVYTDSIFAMTIIDDRLMQPVGFEHLSDGTKRVFLMLTYAIIADIKGLSVIAIEEPENSIHPSLFQNYIDVLSQLVNNCKIIFTSHSPYIIQYLDPSCIYVGLSTDGGDVDFRRIAPSKTKKLLKDSMESNNSVGDYIFNLISDSDSNEYLMEYVENG